MNIYLLVKNNLSYSFCKVMALLIQIVWKFWKMITLDLSCETAWQTSGKLVQVDKNCNIEEEFHE